MSLSDNIAQDMIDSLPCDFYIDVAYDLKIGTVYLPAEKREDAIDFINTYYMDIIKIFNALYEEIVYWKAEGNDEA